MDINYNFVSLIDFLALVQGVLLGFILIAGNRKNRPSLFLGLFLLTYSIELLHSILHATGLDSYSPYLLFLPIKFLFLSPLLFYLYAKSLTRTISLKKNWAMFLPAIIEFVIFLGIYLLPAIKKQSFQESEQYILFCELHFYAAIIYTIILSIMTINLINRHQKKVTDYFSNIENRQLKWVRAIAIFLIIFCSSWFVFLFLPGDVANNFAYPFLSTINVIFIFWVGISGLQQAKVEMIAYKHEDKPTKHSQNGSDLAVERDKDYEIFQQLTERIKREQLFKEQDLTLPALAQKLNVTRRSLSQLINQKSGMNFNGFINQYRIEEAKKILINSKFDHLNMLGIAYEVGFNSKATFFAVFKKMEGISPGVYKKNHFKPK